MLFVNTLQVNNDIVQLSVLGKDKLSFSAYNPVIGLKCFTQSKPQTALIFLGKVEKHALEMEASNTTKNLVGLSVQISVVTSAFRRLHAQA